MNLVAKGPIALGKLPFSVAKQLEDILDVSGDWEQLAGFMNLTQEEVLHLRMRASKSNKSPTSGLILSYGALGRNTNHLFMLLLRIGNIRALKILLPFVDEKHQSMVRNFEQSEPKCSSQCRSTSSANITSNGGTSIMDRLSKLEVDESTSNSVRTNPPVSNNVGHCGNASAGPQSSASRTSCKAPDSALEASLKSTINIPYSELTRATGGFDAQNILGRGGYGVVYYGVWLHTDIAVKRLMPPEGYPVKERVRQSLSELQALSTYRHDNILPLYGYSLDGPEPCLVYQFMSGGSLEDRILCRNGRTPLSWRQRYDIIICAARAINFLHTCTQVPLIHGDIKSANILLNEHLVAKIGDFGLSRKGVAESTNAPSLIASHIKGTLAYLPPEFIRSKHFSRKLDVYSFSVVLLEVATGSRAHSDCRKPENLVDYVKQHFSSPENGTIAHRRNFVDPRNICSDECAWTIYETFIDEGLRCSNSDPELRPSMDELLTKLNTNVVNKI